MHNCVTSSTNLRDCCILTEAHVGCVGQLILHIACLFLSIHIFYKELHMQRLYLLLRCTGALHGSPRNLLGFKGAVGGSLFTAISHGRIGDVVQTSHTPGKETVQWRHLFASDCLNPVKTHRPTE